MDTIMTDTEWKDMRIENLRRALYTINRCTEDTVVKDIAKEAILRDQSTYTQRMSKQNGHGSLFDM